MPGNGTGGAAYGDLLVTSLVVLGGVCVAAFVVVRLAGRLFAAGRARGAHLLAVVARLPLEPRRSLYLVEVAGKTLLVGTSEMGLSLLSELDGAEVRERGEARPSFGELVRAAWLARRSGRSQAHRDGERSVGDAAPSAVAALDERGPARMGSSEARVSGAAALAAGMAREAPPRPGRAPRGGELARSEPGSDSAGEEIA